MWASAHAALHHRGCQLSAPSGARGTVAAARRRGVGCGRPCWADRGRPCWVDLAWDVIGAPLADGSESSLRVVRPSVPPPAAGSDCRALPRSRTPRSAARCEDGLRGPSAGQRDSCWPAQRERWARGPRSLPEGRREMMGDGRSPFPRALESAGGAATYQTTICRAHCRAVRDLLFGWCVYVPKDV